MTTYKYIGRTYKNCDPSGAQQAALKSSTDFANTMKDAYSQVFGAGSSIFRKLSAGWDRIINTTHGMSPEELAAKRSESLNQSAADIQKVNRSIGERAGVTGAVPGVESGIVQAERTGAETEILGQESQREADITAQDYATGRKERDIAMEQESNLPSKAFSPATGFASNTEGAIGEESQQANANEQASTSWMGMVGGLADAAVGGLTSPGGFLGGKKP